jgi:DNA-binding LytR/AlgR family response regulator
MGMESGHLLTRTPQPARLAHPTSPTKPTMPTALLCDDEPLMRANLRDHLLQLWPELQIVGEAENGPQSLRQIEALKPDLAFLDIQMPGLTGLQVAQLVDPSTQIVFVTAFDRYALEAFDAHAVDYLLKPVDPVRLARLVARLKRQDFSLSAAGLAQVQVQAQVQTQVQAQVQTQVQALMRQLASQIDARPAAPALDWLQVDVGKQIRMLHLDDVMYFESDSKYTRVVGDECDGLIRLSLKELLACLDAQNFLQVHRSVIVNRRFVRSVHRRGDAMEIEVRGRPERLRISESNQHLFRAM